jgi:hypothetical protein
VTQTAEVEVNKASTKRIGSLAAENGSQRRIPPVKITAAKLRTKILAGGRCLEKKFLILTEFSSVSILLHSHSSQDELYPKISLVSIQKVY